MQVIIDTREQTPYEIIGAKKSALKTGDYSIEGYENIIAIERKSYDDLYGCLSSSLPRFKKQLKRLEKIKHSYLLIDTTVTNLLMGHIMCKLPGEKALQRLTRLSVNYNVPYCFCDRRGEDVAVQLLHECWKVEERLK